MKIITALGCLLSLILFTANMRMLAATVHYAPDNGKCLYQPHGLPRQTQVTLLAEETNSDRNPAVKIHPAQPLHQYLTFLLPRNGGSALNWLLNIARPIPAAPSYKRYLKVLDLRI